MRKSYILIILFLIFIVVITVIGSVIVTGNTKVYESRDILIIQKNKELYFNVYGYTLDNPNVIVNPYGNSPLTALIMFTSSDYSKVDITIKGKNGDNDIYYSFDNDKYHYTTSKYCYFYIYFYFLDNHRKIIRIFASTNRTIPTII